MKGMRFFVSLFSIFFIISFAVLTWFGSIVTAESTRINPTKPSAGLFNTPQPDSWSYLPVIYKPIPPTSTPTPTNTPTNTPTATATLTPTPTATPMCQNPQTTWKNITPYPQSYTGEVWIKIVPQQAQQTAVHNFDLVWGSWEPSGTFAFDGYSCVTLLFDKNNPDAHPLTFTISPASCVQFGTTGIDGRPVGCKNIDIRGW